PLCPPETTLTILYCLSHRYPALPSLHSLPTRRSSDLSTQANIRPYPPASGALARFLAALRRRIPRGGRFRVNEHGRAFTSNGTIYIGTVPLGQWFPPLTARS